MPVKYFLALIGGIALCVVSAITMVSWMFQYKNVKLFVCFSPIFSTINGICLGKRNFFLEDFGLQIVCF